MIETTTVKNETAATRITKQLLLQRLHGPPQKKSFKKNLNVNLQSAVTFNF